MNESIGIFDSGIGGLSIWREIVKLLPSESTVYYGDSANCPYGGKSEKEIAILTSRSIEFLLSKQCKLIVVACNTATAAAIEQLRANYPVFFVGIEPAVKPAAQLSQSGNIGVLATLATLSGKLFKTTSIKYASNVKIHTQAGYGLVEIVEGGKINDPQTEVLLRKYLEPMIAKNIDQLVLGCTHYPFLIDSIKRITNGKINIIDPAVAVAKQVERILIKHNLHNQSTESPVYKFYSNGNPEALSNILSNIPGLVQFDKPLIHHIAT